MLSTWKSIREGIDGVEGKEEGYEGKVSSEKVLILFSG